MKLHQATLEELIDPAGVEPVSPPEHGRRWRWHCPCGATQLCMMKVGAEYALASHRANVHAVTP